MGQATRTTKLLLDLGKRQQGGANTGKRAALDATVGVLNEARTFYIDFFLAHADKLSERIPYYSEKHLEMRERAISSNELLSWAEACTVETKDHPQPWPGWNFRERFPDLPFAHRRSVIKDAIGKVRGQVWKWVNYPVVRSRYFEQRRSEEAWEHKSPILVLRPHSAEVHFPQTKEIAAKRVRESKLDPDLVTVAVDLNVKNLAVITVRQHEQIIETVFVSDAGLDQQRYRHLRRIAKKQWLSGKPVKGEHSNHQLWRHVHRMNEDAAHKVARSIANVCAKYPGCVLLFERLRKIRAQGASKSRRMNRKQANQLRGKINQCSREKVFAQGMCTVEVNPHGTSQYCSRCGHVGERFSYHQGQRIRLKWGNLFWCPHCHFEVNADWNGSVNVHHSFFHEFHWQPRGSRSG
jgi:IS605 OrfB family transposase